MDLQLALEQRAKVEAFQRKHRIGLLTLLFTDLVGSTKLKQELGDREAVSLIQQHHALVREILSRFPEGEEIGTAGDSFFIVFARPSDAVQFSLLLQSKLRVLSMNLGGGSRTPVRDKTGPPVGVARRADDPPSDAPRALLDRIGVHIGEVVIEERPGLPKPKDMYGLQVDICARVMSLAEGDQILLTRSAFDNARQVLKGQDIEGLKKTTGLQWLNHGPYVLKGVEEPMEICEVSEAGKGALTPPASSEKARRHVSDESEPVLSWRPALELRVPATEWILERKLGEGGFGEVWLGRHERLKDRRVFKFCFRADRVRSLKREVTLFRVLKERVGQHPNIVGIQDVFFEEPPFYLVMDYAHATDLRAWCEKQGFENIPVGTRLEIVAQVADGLQGAHEAGVIHRDVKPSNILIADHGLRIAESENPKSAIRNPQLEVKLTDFGIGQVVSQEALAGMTRMGFTQTMLSAGSSSQTGTHLYMAPELIAGEPASTRSDIYSLGVVLYQLLIGDFSRPLTTDWAKRIIDPLLREDLEKCFAGDPEERFASAGELAKNLRLLEKRQAELAAHHAEVSAKEQVGRRHAQKRKAVIGVFLLIAAALLAGYAALRVGQAALTREARQFFVRGEREFEQWTPSSMDLARREFEQAIQKDPKFAPAYAAIALTYLHGAFFGNATPEQARSIAREKTRLAQKVDETSGEVHTALAQLRFVAYWDLSGAEREFELALKLNPRYATVHHLYSHYLMAVGRTDQSIAEARRYLETNTNSVMANNHLGWALGIARKDDQAIEQEQTALKLNPMFTGAYANLGRAYLHKGDYEKAIDALTHAVAFSGSNFEFKGLLGHAYAAAGRREEARRLLDELIDMKKQKPVDSYQIALIFAGLDQKDEAIKWLERAWQERSSDNLGIIYIKVDPSVDSLRSEPRFTPLLRKMGLGK